MAAVPLPGLAQQTPAYRSAIVALTDDPQLRQTFEESLAKIARERNYDAVASYDIEPDVTRLDSGRFMRTLAEHGIQAVLMLRPASVGAGSSLESVRREIPAELYRSMQSFAKRVSSSDGDDLIAVVHMAIYTLGERKPQLISSGAVWLDEEVDNREQGIERLQALIAANVDAARPAIRQRLGLPPLR